MIRKFLFRYTTGDGEKAEAKIAAESFLAAWRNFFSLFAGDDDAAAPRSVTASVCSDLRDA
jgi:hypothetical protein